MQIYPNTHWTAANPRCRERQSGLCQLSKWKMNTRTGQRALLKSRSPVSSEKVSRTTATRIRIYFCRKFMLRKRILWFYLPFKRGLGERQEGQYSSISPTPLQQQRLTARTTQVLHRGRTTKGVQWRTPQWFTRPLAAMEQSGFHSHHPQPMSTVIFVSLSYFCDYKCR